MILRKKMKQLYNLRVIDIYVILRCHRHTYFKNYYIVNSYTKNTFKLSSSSKKFKWGQGADWWQRVDKGLGFRVQGLGIEGFRTLVHSSISVKILVLKILKQYALDSLSTHLRAFIINNSSVRTININKNSISFTYELV